ncbi:hypothetical protein EIP86_010234 [Pleurotus ostreatoroseus]|nr:hypothetical protein EIP86_010234 [Pleurotus ostreatoroseus]
MLISEAHPSHALIALDALRFGEARAQVAFVPSGEGHDLFKLKVTVPRSVRMNGEDRKTFKLDLTVLGQLSEDDFRLETTVPGGGGVPTTTVHLSLHERRSPSAQLLWQDAQSAVAELHRLVDEPVDLHELVSCDEQTGAMRLRMTGSETHSEPEDTHGFPIYDADTKRIVLDDASQFPFGAAMHAVFQLRCVRDAHGTLMMRADIVSLSLV